MDSIGNGASKAIGCLKSHSCVVVPTPSGYRVGYRGGSNLEWQGALLWMPSLDGYSTMVINSSSAFLFRL